MAGLALTGAQALRGIGNPLTTIQRAKEGYANLSNKIEAYDLLETGDVQENAKNIGDEIVKIINTKYIDGNLNNTPEKIKAQIKIDLLQIYYEKNSNNAVVKQNIHAKICDAWYAALSGRIDNLLKDILKDIVLLLNKEDIDTESEPTDGAEKSSESTGGTEILSEPTDDKANPSELAGSTEILSELTDGAGNRGELAGGTKNSSESRRNKQPVGGFGFGDMFKKKSTEGTTPKPEGTPTPGSNIEPSGDPTTKEGADDAKPQSESETEQKKKEEEETRNAIYFEKLINYKSQLFAIENFERRSLNRSATVSQVYNLHEGIISKILCNYAIINRDKLVGKLRKIILGQSAINQIEEYKRNKRWLKGPDPDPKSEAKDPTQPKSIYESFIEKLDELGNFETYKKPSEQIERPGDAIPSSPETPENRIKIGYLQHFINFVKPKENSTTDPLTPVTIDPDTAATNTANPTATNTANPTVTNTDNTITEGKTKGGGQPDKRMPKHIPATYNWEEIKGHVETELQLLIQNNISLDGTKTAAIKEGFKEVFLQVNCDSLKLDKSNKFIKPKLNKQYELFLERMCKSIPDKRAANILKSYILRNFNTFAKFLKERVFDELYGPIESTLFSYRNVPSKLIGNDNIKPIYKEIDPNPVNLTGKDAELDKCCDERKGESGLNAEGVSEYFMTKKIGDEPSISDRITASILLPVFNVFKKEFVACSESPDFLQQLFDMYSGRSLKFMLQIRDQFSSNEVNDYIERYILTKHPYTKNIISECIKHAADVQTTLSENIKDVDNIKTHISNYALFLMHTNCTNHKIDKKTEHAYTNYILDNSNTLFNSFVSLDGGVMLLKNALNNIIEFIITKGDDTQKSYNKGLGNVFGANKSIYSSSKKLTKKVRVRVRAGITKRNISSFFNPLKDQETSQGTSQETTSPLSEEAKPTSEPPEANPSSSAQAAANLSPPPAPPPANSSSSAPPPPPANLSSAQAAAAANPSSLAEAAFTSPRYDTSVGIDIIPEDYKNIGGSIANKLNILMEDESQRPVYVDMDNSPTQINLNNAKTKINEQTDILIQKILEHKLLDNDENGRTKLNIIKDTQAYISEFKKNASFLDSTTNIKLGLISVDADNNCNLVYQQSPNKMYRDFALDCFKCVKIKGNGNCLMNAVAWWIINYNTVDANIFGGIIDSIELGTGYNLKNKKITDKINVNANEQVLELFGTEDIDNDSKYYNTETEHQRTNRTRNADDSSNLYITKYDLNTGTPTFTNNRNGLILVESTILGDILRKDILCEFCKKLKIDLLDAHGNNYIIKSPVIETWYQRLLITINNLKNTLPSTHNLEITDWNAIIRTLICDPTTDMDESYIGIICYLFQLNIVLINGPFLNGNNKQKIKFINEYIYFLNRPIIFIYRNPGHFDVLYPCDQVFAQCIYPLPVLEL